MHKAQNCIISCIDFRFQNSIQSWLKDNGYVGDSDFIILAGAGRDFVKPLEQFHKDSIVRQIQLSLKLHDPENIIVIDHQDCGGYAQDGTIPAGLSIEEDQEAHKKYAEETAKMMKEMFPQKNFKEYYARLDGQIVELI